MIGYLKTRKQPKLEILFGIFSKVSMKTQRKSGFEDACRAAYNVPSRRRYIPIQSYKHFLAGK